MSKMFECKCRHCLPKPVYILSQHNILCLRKTDNFQTDITNGAPETILTYLLWAIKSDSHKCRICPFINKDCFQYQINTQDYFTRKNSSLHRHRGLSKKNVEKAEQKKV